MNKKLLTPTVRHLKPSFALIFILALAISLFALALNLQPGAVLASNHQAMGPTCTVTSIGSNFNGTPINAGRTIWFNAVLKPSGLGSGPTTIYFRNQIIQFRANSVDYNLTVPNTTLTFSANVTHATTQFDSATQTWVTQEPLHFSGNAFLSALGFPVPTNLPGGINPVTWSGQFSSDTSGVSVNWQWAAAVYTQFNTDYNALGVLALDAADHAGTPENYKAYVIGGARGGGGSNYTGSYSGTASSWACPDTTPTPTDTPSPTPSPEWALW